MGALPSPTISRAPSKNTGPPPPPWKPAAAAHAQAAIRKHDRIRDNDMNFPPQDRGVATRTSEIKNG